MTTVVCVPQWQGLGAAQARRLMEGARRTAELVDTDARGAAPVLAADREMAAGVRSLDVLRESLRLTHGALAAIDDVVVTAGGAAASSSRRWQPLAPDTAPG